jgi:hypothetical protein
MARILLNGAIAAVLLLAACADKGSSDGATTAPEGAMSSVERSASLTPQALAGALGKASSMTTQGLRGRSAELVNPDNSTMVFLYYDLAGITPPIERWVEDDSRVKFAPAFDKAALRNTIRAELESATAAVRGVGYIRLSMHANLSDYDPTYGEFSVRALAPSSMVSFDAMGQHVSLKFGNGRTAQIWRVPQSQAQAIRDKIGHFGNVSLDALLRITAVQPGPGGGTITTGVVEYEMRETRSGLTIGRVQIVQK